MNTYMLLISKVIIAIFKFQIADSIYLQTAIMPVIIFLHDNDISKVRLTNYYILFASTPAARMEYSQHIVEILVVNI